MAENTHYRSKTLAAWLALLLGVLGLHRMYLYGLTDRWAWLHPWPSAAGLVGVLRMRELGQDDQLAWFLIPFLGLMICVAMLSAIIYALTPDERWDQQHNPGRPTTTTSWGSVLAAVTALLLGGSALVGTVAFGGQKFFEWQLESERAQNSSRPMP
jgi:hypothetical protein